MSLTCVYHICHLRDKYDFTKGYIGISDNPLYRWERHKRYEKNGRLRKIYNKYDDIIEYILVKGSREYCLYIEKTLRPSDLIGWNFVSGGGDPPSQKNKVMSESQKANIGKSNSGEKGPGWKGWWVVDGIEYVSTKEAAKTFNISRKTVRDRVLNPKFPNWSFKKV